MKDVKKKHLEEIAARKIEEIRIEEERKIHNEIYDKWKSNWRDELELKEDSGMTVAGMMKTTLPSEGDEVLDADDTKEINITWDDVSYARANNVDGVSEVFDVGPVNDPVTGVKYLNVGAGQMHPNGNGNEKGTPEGSGFNMGGSYARMNGSNPTGYSPNAGPRYVTLVETDTTNFSHMRITAIQGTGFEGGDGNGGNGGWDTNDRSLKVRYWLPGMTDFKYLSVNPQGQTTGNADVIVPFDANASTPTNFTIEIPEYARNKDVRFQIYQPSKTTYYSDSGQDWGISNISYQRKTPINVFVSLDSPEASSFVRLGGKDSDPKKRKKSLEGILRAGKEYTNKYLGSDFPGSSAELSPEISPPEQDIADIQQQNRDSTYQKIKDRFQIPKQTKEFKQFSYVQQRYITKTSDLFKNLPDIGLTNSQISNAFKSQEELSKLTSALNDAYWKKRVQILGTLDNPPEKPPTKSQIDALNDESARLMDFSNFASIAISQGILYNPLPAGSVLTPADVDAAARDPRVQNVDSGTETKPQGEPVKDENPKGFLDLISDPAAKLMGYAPAKNAFDYYMNQLKSQNVPPGGEIKGEHNLTNMMDKKEMNLMKTMIDGVMADPTLTTDIQREVELNKGYLNVRAASKNFKNITGFFDPAKNDGFKIDRGEDGVIKNIKIKKSYDFTDSGDTSGASVVSGAPAMSYAAFSGLNKYFRSADYKIDSRGRKISGEKIETPTMNLEIDFGIPTISKTKSKRKYDEYGRLKESSFYKYKELKLNRKVNESNLFEKLKKRSFFNPKDIKPEFPPEPPPQIDPKTGMHPEYGKHADRYKKLDPHSANAMPPTGDPELDALVDKQRTKKRPAERRKEYVKNFEKIKQVRKGT